MSEKELLFKMYPTREKRLKFMANCALSFGIRLDLLSELLGEDKNELYKEYQKRDIYNVDSLNFLFHHGFKLQDEAKQDFLAYFSRLSEAFLKNDRGKCQEILKELSKIDAAVLKFKKSHKFGAQITEEDILNILKFQLKYGITSKCAAEFAGISACSYINKVDLLKDKYPELISNYHYVADFWQNLRRETERR